ncbi:hypothetical protein [Leptothoe sp. PORK10 BA2]|uniref:hypothetical protein n=1 Tax=Leptothoe sp. PORK10 BA2 TaxID=3110254 RepID=UPI002B1FE1E3|nr:hypothetical protein [Leptothoe sp. PORK10 BA2]MEA5464219.1 hypothetical protein [Leptothoe sp. PORK10 BA2]
MTDEVALPAAAHCWLARRWSGLRRPMAEWSLRVSPRGVAPRPKWLAWLGVQPAASAVEHAALTAALGFPGGWAPEHFSFLRTMAVGFRGTTPECLYHSLDAAPGTDLAAVYLRHEPDGTRVYRFRLFHECGADAALDRLSPELRRVVEALLRDPVVRLRSGFGLRDAEPRVYIAFPHEPPIRRLRALLDGVIDLPPKLAAHDDLNFRQLAVMGDGSGEMAVYMQAATNRLPEGLQDARRLIALALPWYHASDMARRMIAEAEREARGALAPLCGDGSGSELRSHQPD